MTVINFDDHRPADDIAMFTLAKTLGGKLLIYPTWCDENWIDGFPDISSRFRELVVLIEGALPYMEECAIDFTGQNTVEDKD